MAMKEIWVHQNLEDFPVADAQWAPCTTPSTASTATEQQEMMVKSTPAKGASSVRQNQNDLFVMNATTLTKKQLQSHQNPNVANIL